MKKYISLLLLTIALTAAGAAQNFMTVTAHNIYGGSGAGTLLAAGSIAFQPVSSQGTIIGYQVGGGGQQIFFPNICAITNGAIVGNCQVANTSLTNPINVCFSVTVKNKDNKIVLGGVNSGYTCVQPQTTNFWCTAGVCNFDMFVPNAPSLTTALLAPAGVSSLGGIYASTCPLGQLVNGVLVTGHLSCLPAASGGGSVFTVFGRTGDVLALPGDYSVTQVTGAAPSFNPVFVGVVTLPITGITQCLHVGSTGIITGTGADCPGGTGAVSSVFSRTGIVTSQNGDYTVTQITGAAPLISPVLTGVPLAPTATTGNNTTQIATTQFVTTAVAAGVAVSSVFGRTGVVVATGGDYNVTQITGAAPLASPVFTGSVFLPILGITSQCLHVNNVGLLSGTGVDCGSGGGGAVASVFGRTGVVVAASGDYTAAQVTGAAPLASPNLTGVPLAPTAAPGTNTLQIASTAFVLANSIPSVFGRTGAIAATSGDYTVSQITGAAPIASPSLTGAPLAPNAAANTNTAQIATTAFVLGQAGAVPPLINGTAAVGTSLLYARQDHVHPTDTSRAPLASPSFTGTLSIPLISAPFLATNGSGNLIAGTTTGTGSVLVLSVSPTFTGVPLVPTAAGGTSTLQAASTAFVTSAVAAGAPPTGAAGGDLSGTYPNPGVGKVNGAIVPLTSTLLGSNGAGQFVSVSLTGTGATAVLSTSPTLAGVPLAPTAAANTSTTQIATTAYVVGQAGTAAPLINGAASVGTSLLYARQDHVHPTDTSRSPLASPSFTGVPLAPNPALGTNNSQIATTSFVAALTLPLGVSSAGEILTNGGSVVGSSVDGSNNVFLPAGVNLTTGCFSISGVCIPSTPTVVPGTNKQIIFNDSGAFGANGGLTFDKSTGNLTVGGVITGAGFASSGAGSWWVSSAFGLTARSPVAATNQLSFDITTGNVLCSPNGATFDYCVTSFNKLLSGTGTGAYVIGAGGSLAATGGGTIAATSVVGFSAVTGKSLTANNTLSLTGTDGSVLNFGAGGTLSYVGNFPSTAHFIGTASSLPVTATAVDLAAIDYGVTTGAVNVLSVLLSPAPASLTAGMIIRALPNLANTITAPTLNLNGLGAKTITKLGTAALSVGDLSITALAVFQYDGTNWQLLNPQTISSSGSVTSVGFVGDNVLDTITLSGPITGAGNLTATAKSFAAHNVVINNTAGSATPVAGLIGTSDSSVNWYAAGSGTAQAQTVTLVPAATSLATGLVVHWLPTAANTGATPTLAVNALTAKNITKCGTLAVVANDLLTTAIAEAFYDGTQFELTNPQTIACGSSGGVATGISVANTSSVTVTNPTANTDTQLMELALSAGYLNVINQVADLHGSGVYSTGAASSPAFTVSAKLCTVSGCGSGTVVNLGVIASGAASASATTNANWNYNLELATNTTGSTGNLLVKGSPGLSVNLSNSLSAADTIYGDLNTTNSGNINLTSALFLDFTVAMSTTGASNSFKQMLGFLSPQSQPLAGATIPLVDNLIPSIGTSTAFARADHVHSLPPNVINYQPSRAVSSVTAVSGVDTTLYTATLPANLFCPGCGVRITAVGRHQTGVTATTWSMQLGTAPDVTLSTNSNGAASERFTINIMEDPVTPNLQHFYLEGAQYGSFLVSNSVAVVDSTQTTSGTISLVFSVNQAATETFTPIEFLVTRLTQ